MENQQTENRVPELDGLRGLAILLVMLFHILPESIKLTKNPLFGLLARSVSMGWVGVDIFFVLSGFLISSILLNTRDHPHYFRNFYARRILRIFPLYYLVIGTIFIFLPILSPDLASVQQPTWPYYVFYVQNWFTIPTLITSNLYSISLYFGPAWSLAIEEQFYLIWPALVLLLSRRKLAFLSIAIVILSLAARLLLVQFDNSWKYLQHFIYYGSFTRFDGFSVGALIAIAFRSEQWKRFFSHFAWPVFLVSVAGMIAIVINNSDVDPLGKNYWLNTWGYAHYTGVRCAAVDRHHRPQTGPAAGLFPRPHTGFFRQV